ncbi:MAG: hypothetical protein KDC87_20410 [Planctomycetes bacterium]|nr:hypothetical protein [Planctomycetota bacterium]
MGLAYLDAWSPKLRRYTGVGTSRKDGQFRVFCSEAPDQGAVEIEVAKADNFELPAKRLGPFRWGTTDIRIVLRRALTFPLQVVDSESGKPITHYYLRCHAASAPGGTPRGVRLGGTHAEGRVVVDQVARGKNILVVIPGDQRYPTSDVIEFTATDRDPGPARVALTRMSPLKVVVRDAERNLVANCSVELIRPGTMPVPPQGLVNRRGQEECSSSDPGVRFAEQLSVAKTDALGQCVVYGPKGATDLILRVGSGPTARVHEGVSTGPDHLRIEVER